ncbi:hypothetical protein OTU49_015106, partial [Cherax quadricarinatus]
AFRTSRFLVSPVVERKQIPSEEAGGGSGGRVIQQQEETITSTPNPLMDDSPKSDSITASSTAALPVPTSSASIVLLPSQDQQQNDGWVSGVGMTVASSVATSQPGSGGPTPPHHCTPENTYTSDHQAKLSQQNSLEKSDSVTANSNLSELARKLQQLGTSGGTVPPLSLSSSHTLPPMSAPLSAPSHPGTPISLATQPTFSQELSMQLAGGGSGSVDGSILTTTSLGVPVQEANVVMQPQGPHYTNRTTDIPTTELIQQGVQSMGIDDGRAITTPPITSDSVGTPLVTPAGVLMTAPIPVEAVGIPVNTDMFPSLKPTPQPIINSTAMHHITSLPPEMSAPGVSIPPEMGVSVEQSGHTDTSQVTLQSQAAELGCSGGEPGHVPGDGHVGVEAHYVPVVPGHITMGLAPGTPTAVPAGMTPGMSMTGATLGLHHGVMLAVPTGSGQRSRMDLNALREQLQKLVPGARLTLAHHDTEESVTTGSPSIDGLQPVYPQPSAIGGIPLTVMGSNRVEDIMPMGHGEGLHTSLDGSVDTSMILPHTVRLPGGETVALVPQVMMEGRCPSTLGYSTMVPLNLEKASAFNTVGSEEAYAWRSAGVSPAPLQSTIPLSRTPSLLDSEEQVDKQTRTSRFQVTKVVEESVRRASDTSTCSSPVSSPVRRGRFAVTKVAESAESGECALGGSALTPGLSESHPHVFFRGDSQGGTPSEPPSITASAAPSMTSSFVSEDTPATTPATPAADLETFTQHRSTANNSTEDCAPTIEGSQFSGEDDELETVRLDLEDFSEDDDSFQQLLSKQEHEEAELRRRHQQEREAFKVQRMQRSHQNKRPKSLRLASSPGPPPSGLSPTSPHCHTDCMQMEDCKLSVRTNADSVLSDSSLETSVAATSSKKGRTISEDMLELVQNLGAPRQVIRPSPGKITLNQMMGQQKSSATVPPIGQRSFYPSVGIAAAQYHGQFLSNFQTFPLPYQRLSDGSAVAVSQADDGAGVPSSTSSSSTNLQQQQQQQLPPVSSASWVHWQQQ